MAARLTATRAEVIHAAASKYAGKELPHWPDSEYLHGICSVIADAFGTDAGDPDTARSDVWEEIRIAHAAHARGVEANIYASEVMQRIDFPDQLTYDAARTAIFEAYLAGKAAS